MAKMRESNSDKKLDSRTAWYHFHINIRHCVDEFTGRPSEVNSTFDMLSLLRPLIQHFHL